MSTISFHHAPLSHMVPQLFRTNLGVEFVVAEVERGVDGLEWLEIPAHLLFLTLLCDDRATVQHQPVRGHSRIKPNTKTTYR